MWRNATTLPAELTSLVGREAELDEIANLLELATTRLLTLTGTGGCGKTRLALRTGRNLTGIFQQGVWLVELAPVSDPYCITQTLIGSIGLVVDPYGQPLDTLIAFLNKHPVLLILDNCEHVVTEAARLSELLLRACPDLLILATSRESLGVPGEGNIPGPFVRITTRRG